MRRMAYTYRVYGVSLLCLLWAVFPTLSANNLQIHRLPLLQKQGSNLELVTDISWEHSWRLPKFGNWDAVWIFAKYRRKGEKLWNPLYFQSQGHSVGQTSGVEPAFEPGSSEVGGVSRNLGVFVYRAKPGHGKVEWKNLRLRLSADQSLPDPSQLDVQVFALEMVMIPEAPFYLGSGSTSESYAFKNTYNDSAFYLTSEAPLLLSNTAASTKGLGCRGNVWIGSGDDRTAEVLLPAEFPKGYASFYVMKYELTQQAYADFLNLLTETQQKTRIRRTDFYRSNPAFFWKYVYDRNSYRNGIMYAVDGPDSLFVCNYLQEEPEIEKTFREYDGMNLPMNFLSLEDMLAYLDWAGLRPLTELEYEKICRGPLYPQAGEYAWGSTYLKPSGNPLSTAMPLGGGEEETPSGNYNESGVPLRVGSFAREATNRIQAGAAYYGVMDMTGNLSERYVCIHTRSAHAFKGEAGDGILDENGNASPRLSWGREAKHYIWKGGVTNSYLSVSDRYYYGGTNVNAYYYSGLRGGRSR